MCVQCEMNEVKHLCIKTGLSDTSNVQRGLAQTKSRTLLVSFQDPPLGVLKGGLGTGLVHCMLKPRKKPGYGNPQRQQKVLEVGGAPMMVHA